VLCKEIRVDAGYITFFTNYLSRKGAELSANTRAAAVMYWDVLHRQVRLEGRVTLTTAAESDAYFASRAWQSRIGAWASQQSAPIASRAELVRAAEAAAQRFGTPMPTKSEDTAPDPGVPIARPPHWGGYHLWIDAVELWVEGAARLHDRARWTRTLEADGGGFKGGRWSATRLQP
jgi:pyridoxamine 5'-phosphate oxidase